MILNDLVILEPGSAKFTKALAAVASVLHPAFDALLPIPGKSKESCVLCSATVRDFLWKVGFKDAKVTTVYLALKAVDANGVEVWSAGVGDHSSGRVPLAPGVSAAERHGYWNGHMVVEVPSEGTLIDTTLFHMKRPAWPLLPGMMAVPIFDDGMPAYGMERISGVEFDQKNGNRLIMVWLREPNDGWRDAPDYADRALRAPVVRALRTTFGNWRG